MSISRVKYPTAFVRRVKRTFPNWKGLHRALDAGSQKVGLYLDNVRGDIKPQFVLNCLKTLNREKLKSEATKRIKATKLYTEWCGYFLPTRE